MRIAVQLPCKAIPHRISRIQATQRKSPDLRNRSNCTRRPARQSARTCQSGVNCHANLMAVEATGTNWQTAPNLLTNSHNMSQRDVSESPRGLDNWGSERAARSAEKRRPLFRVKLIQHHPGYRPDSQTNRQKSPDTHHSHCVRIRFSASNSTSSNLTADSRKPLSGLKQDFLYGLQLMSRIQPPTGCHSSRITASPEARPSS